MHLRFPILSVMAFLGASTGGLSVASGAELPPPFQLRQRIIRAAEEDVLQALEKKPEDEALAKQLLQWLESGKAKVMSDLSTQAAPGSVFKVENGKVYKWVSENAQDFDGPVLTATDWQDYFLGEVLQGQVEWPFYPMAKVEKGSVPAAPFSRIKEDPKDILGGKHALGILWYTEIRALMSPKVRWPLVWPENKEPKVGWYEQDDFLVQHIITRPLIEPGRDSIVAFLRPATDMETEPASRELDVVLVQTSSGEAPAQAAHSTDTESPAAPRVHFYGFGVSDAQAVELLATRSLQGDATLLARLQSRVREGKALRRLVFGSQVNSARTTLSTAREHSYPTEMPTIPSAWSMREVGTRVEMELHGRSLQLKLEHHPARFRWAKWACALDAPELIMQQPQFFSQRVETSLQFPKDNVALVTAMRNPECLKGEGKGPVIGETLLVFAELDQPTGRPPVKSESSDPPQVFAEFETMVFELSADEAGSWDHTESNQPVDDEQRFQKALSKVKDGTAKVICHLATSTRTNCLTSVDNVEEIMYVWAYSPADYNPTGRYRPTAVAMRPVGSSWKLDPGVVNPEAFAGTEPILSLNYALRHDVLPAVQPTLEASLKYGREHDGTELPEPTFTTDEWVLSVNLLSGKARCLGPVRPKAAQFQDRIHVAFVRAVVRK